MVEFNPENVQPYIAWLTNDSIKHIPAKHEWLEIKRDMCIHIDGEEASHLIAKRRPNEPADIREFREANYIPITKGIMQQAIDGLFRIFDEQGYEITYGNQETKDYAEARNFEGYSLMQWVQNKLLVSMLRDPNAWVVAIPSGDGILDNTKKVDVEFRVVASAQIMDIQPTNFTWLTYEKSAVTDGSNNITYDGNIYMIVTDNAVYNLIQIGKKTDNQYELEKVYQHDFGFVPASVLGGTWREEECGYESFFASFVPYGNEAIVQFSDFQGVLIKQAQPIMEVLRIECKEEGCINGYYHDGLNRYKCRRCKGTGYTNLDTSPYGVIIAPENNARLGKEETRPAVQYHLPPVDGLKFLDEMWKSQLELAKASLHLNYIDEAQSGTAKMIDRENQYAMILKISNRSFDIVYDLVWWIERYRNPNGYVEPQVVKPEDFSLRNEKDLMDELNAMKTAGAPINAVIELVKEILKTRWAGNSMVYKEQMFLLEYDPLYVYTQTEKLALSSAGMINKEQYVASIHSGNILQRLKREKNVSLAPENYNSLYVLMDKEVAKIMLELEQGKVTLTDSNGNPIGNPVTLPLPPNKQTMAQA